MEEKAVKEKVRKGTHEIKRTNEKQQIGSNKSGGCSPLRVL